MKRHTVGEEAIRFLKNEINDTLAVLNCFKSNGYVLLEKACVCMTYQGTVHLESKFQDILKTDNKNVTYVKVI